MSLPIITIPQGYQPAPDAFKGRVVLVTGAGQGLGRVAALALARHGATVILHGRHIGKLEAVYDAIDADGLPQAAILPLDYAKTTQSELDAFAQAISSTLGGLDGIFHGASHFVSPMPLSLHDLDMWQQHYRVNVSVPAALTQACMPMLKRAVDASVVFLTETHALEPRAYWGAFAVAKSALNALTAILADESTASPAPRFNLCLPGPVATSMRAQSHPGELATSLPAAESLVPGFLYLLGPDSRKINGCILDCRPKSPVE